MNRPLAEMEAELDNVAAAPKTEGTLELVIRRPTEGEREVLAHADLDPAAGVVGDDWLARCLRRSPDAQPNVDKQLNIMCSRAAKVMIGDRADWPLAGDQLYVDLDLSRANLPAGSRLMIGDEAVIEVTAAPHTGCAKFHKRFGEDALKLTRTDDGDRLRLRGIAAKVITAGAIGPGDQIRKV